VAVAVAEAQERAVLLQKAKVQSLENQLALPPMQMKALEQSKVVPESALKIAEPELERMIVTAPFDARVAQVDVEISQFVGAGTNMGKLDGAAAAEIDVRIPPRQMAAFERLAFAGGARPPDREGRVPVGLTAHVALGHPRGTESQNAEAAMTQASMISGLILGLIAVHLVLSLQLRSYAEPFVVMATIPFVLIGMVAGHLIIGVNLAMPWILGLVSLAGIVLNDSILLVNFIKNEHEPGVTSVARAAPLTPSAPSLGSASSC
jgi:multidrug efflux pump subunit AcrA (membrane-fusion protein)